MSDKQVQEFYDEIAHVYDNKRFAKTYHRQIDRLERVFILEKVRPGTSVLEIGPGTGRFTTHLVEKASAVTAVDISDKMLNQLQAKVSNTRLTVHNLDVHNLSALMDHSKFDTVICMRVLPHLEDPEAVLTLMSKAIKPDGNVVFDLWNPYSFIGIIRKLFRRPSYVLTRFYSYRSMVQMIKSSGLVIEDSLAWGYPRIGSFSLDRLGNLAFKQFGYSIIFCARRS